MPTLAWWWPNNSDISSTIKTFCLTLTSRMTVSRWSWISFQKNTCRDKIHVERSIGWSSENERYNLHFKRKNLDNQTYIFLKWILCHAWMKRKNLIIKVVSLTCNYVRYNIFISVLQKKCYLLICICAVFEYNKLLIKIS